MYGPIDKMGKEKETERPYWYAEGPLPSRPLLHSAVGSGHPGSSGTVCSPISQWDLGNNWKPQVPRIWALLLPVHVKIVVLFSQLQAHCGPSKPTQPSAACMARQNTVCLSVCLSVQLACFVQLFCVYSKYAITARVQSGSRPLSSDRTEMLWAILA